MSSALEAAPQHSTATLIEVPREAAPHRAIATVIELLHTPGCPHVEETRSLLRSCLAELAIDTPIQEREGDYPSPTILVNGVDVMGRTAVHGAMCRLDLPTRGPVIGALTG
ncbi:MAG: alkylmercury lyase [Candidatus Dormiibacterota bacterium]